MFELIAIIICLSCLFIGDILLDGFLAIKWHLGLRLQGKLNFMKRKRMQRIRRTFM